MRRILLFLVLLLPILSMAQSIREQRLDSLEIELKKANHDTTRIHLMCLLTFDYGGIDSTKTFDYGFKALELSKKINSLKGLTASHIAVGGGFMDYFILDRAKFHLIKATELAEKLIVKQPSKANIKLWIRGHYNLGLTYGYEGDHDKEIALTQKVIPVAEQQNEDKFLANVYTNLGILNNNLNRLGEAYKSFTKSGALHKKINDPKDIIFDRLSFSNTLFGLDSLAKMKEVLDEAKFYLDKDPEALDWYLFYSEMGLYLTSQGSYKEAIESYDKASVILEDQKLSGTFYPLLERYSKTYAKMEDYEAADIYMTKFLNVALNNKNGPLVLSALYNRATYRAENENFKSAYEDLLQALKLNDSIQPKELELKLKDLELSYETAEKEREILKLENEKNESALILEERKSEAYLMAIIIGSLAILLSLGFLFYQKKLRKERKKVQLQEAEVQFLKQEQQNKIFSAMIEGQEKERKRLAIDLHDGLGGRLSGISMNLSKLDKDEPKEYPKMQLQKVMKDLNDSLTELRGIARNMMPETLVKFGLKAALKDYCSSMSGNDTKITLQFYGPEKDITPNHQVTIYRVIQELINNAVKHAQATEVLVQYIREGNSVDITVEDNGVGFSQEIAKNNKESGMGLSNLRTRVDFLQGNLDFNTQENEGTTVNIHLTLDAA